ncbi:hypothetical protein LR48_Vigan04g019000 [Vigna angularis]|uniref:F-box domain-containing protein n=2 Tax=Phaseolus angularis TaxID=3914 RepID=A0A0L9UBT3_PHAAN|nr:uncharacterized protein LOC108330158 [Vigna angularis]KAG2398707.1 uncharacterized protein HKW66_Vig0088120 [Vigna angularis]KOM39992.1 hypothetical protein LR48_Vigan04g019000 [Vigna angularis]
MAATKPNTTIHNLFDDSLTEIFCKLPCKSLFSCKSVSKHWLTLISNPNFHSVYLTHQHTLFHKIQSQGEDPDQPSFILKPYNALVIAPNLPSLQLGSLENHLSLTSLGSDFEPANIVPQLRSVLKFVFACSNGLLVYGNPRPRHKCVYHVRNPLTKDSLKLPCAPTVCDHAGVLVGFMCDPYYCLAKENSGVSIVPTSERRFRVVRIPAFSDTRVAFDVEVFSSETGKWKRFVVSCPQGFACGFFLTSSSVEHEGKLYFMGGGRVLVYDPYDYECVASVIELPRGFGEAYRGCLGVSCGKLQLSEFPISPSSAFEAYSGRVWELEYCGMEEERRWKLVHEFCLPEIIGPMFQELKALEVEYARGCSRILAFHPYVKDSVFLKFGDNIICCNLLTRRFRVCKYGGLSLLFYPVIPVLLPWWPTPIPSSPSLVDPSV